VLSRVHAPDERRVVDSSDGRIRDGHRADAGPFLREAPQIRHDERGIFPDPRRKTIDGDEDDDPILGGHGLRRRRSHRSENQENGKEGEERMARHGRRNTRLFLSILILSFRLGKLIDQIFCLTHLGFVMNDGNVGVQTAHRVLFPMQRRQGTALQE
jgi:hypothetical protein